jgi:hypothetical protein
MQQVFMSYAAQDKVRAEQIYVYLERAGFKTWRYDADLKPDNDWKPQVDAALHNSSYCIVILSPYALKSPAVASEYRYFLAQNKPVILALVSDVDSDDIPERLRNNPLVDLRNPTHTSIAELINAINDYDHVFSLNLLEPTAKKPLKLTLNLSLNDFGNEKFRDLVAKLNDIGIEEIEVVNIDRAS